MVVLIGGDSNLFTAVELMVVFPNRKIHLLTVTINCYFIGTIFDCW